MKKLLVIVSFMLIAAGTGYSQSKMTEEEKEEAIARHQAYMEKLNLTEEQKPKVEEINMTYFEGLSSIKKTNGSKLEKYRSFKSLSSTRDEEMKKVLTKEQYTIYKENQQEQRENFKERRRKNR
jgi:Spy/CpxP family protein refolding chaperone